MSERVVIVAPPPDCFVGGIWEVIEEFPLPGGGDSHVRLRQGNSYFGTRRSNVRTADPAIASTWELVHDVAFERVRRMRVPLGWLYQTEIELKRESPIDGVRSPYLIGWHPPIFVPDLHDASPGASKLDDIAARLTALRGDMASVGGNRLSEIAEIVGDLVALLRTVRP